MSATAGGSATLSAEDVACYHARLPGITEDLLVRLAADVGAGDPYDWLLDALTGLPPAAVVIDLACGSAALADRMPPNHRYLGLDRSPAELGGAGHRRRTPAALTRADAFRLPLPDGTADAVVASMSLMLLAPLDAALDEVARVLRPGGRLVATVPTPGLRTPADVSVVLGLVRALRRPPVAVPEPMEGPGLGERFAAAGLRLCEDAVRRYSLAVPDEATASLLARSYYAPAAGDADLARAVASLCARLGSPPLDLGYPLRRLVAVRTHPDGGQP